jgi:hypothetical protein
VKLLILKIQFALSVFLLICVVTVGCSTSESGRRDTISKEGGLLQPEHVKLAGLVIFSDTQQVVSKHLGRVVGPLWTPSTNSVWEAVNQLPSYLLSRKSFSAKENLSKSFCQAAGITFEGRRGILLNFLPADGANGMSFGWREHFIKVYDGGPRWWSVIYLSEEKEFTALHFDSGF